MLNQQKRKRTTLSRTLHQPSPNVFHLTSGTMAHWPVGFMQEKLPDCQHLGPVLTFWVVNSCVPAVTKLLLK